MSGNRPGRQPHHKGRRFIEVGARVIAAANANPRAVCCHCERTLAEHPPTKTGKAQTWTRGHTIPGSTTWRPWLDVTRVPPPGDWLAPAASSCNSADGNTKREPHTERWWTA